VSWAGTTPLLAVAGVALWLAAMDADVGLAGEVDHSDRDGPCDRRGIAAAAPPPAAVAVVTLVLGLGGMLGAQVGGWSLRAVQIGLAVIVPAAVGAVAGATVSTVRSVTARAAGCSPSRPSRRGSAW